MAELPVDPVLAKCLLAGAAMGCSQVREHLMARFVVRLCRQQVYICGRHLYGQKLFARWCWHAQAIVNARLCMWQFKSILKMRQALCDILVMVLTFQGNVISHLRIYQLC